MMSLLLYRLVVSFIFFLTISSVTAAKLDKINHPKYFSANFKQVRYVKSAKIKLTSTGTIKSIKENEIEWKQLTPFENLMIISNKKNKLQNPFVESISKVVFSAIKGDLQEVEKMFLLKKEDNKITGIPKDDLVKKAIRKIVITTGKTIESFYIEEVSGSYFDISIKDFKEIRNSNVQK